MELNPVVLLLKSVWPSIKELILGKHTLKEALAENIVASILLLAMTLMLFVTIYINTLAKDRYKEILILRDEVSTLNRTIDNERLGRLSDRNSIPKVDVPDEVYVVPTPVPTIEDMVGIPKVPPDNSKLITPRPVILRKHAMDKLNAVPR